MDLTVNARMAEYYEKFIELQEKLRKSEGERMNLEMKFNEMMQKSREEEQIYYRKLRSQYKKFLEEDRKRQERNEKIIRTLERIETRIDMLTSKTERFKSLRKQYQNYLQRVSSSQDSKPVNSSRYNLLPNEKSQISNDNDKLFETDNQKLNEEKMEILDRYLESISSQRCKELIEKRKHENEQLDKLDVLKDRLNDGFDSSKAQSIAEDIMNSIYNRHYNKDQNDEQKYLSSNNERPSVKVSFENNDLVTSINVSDDDEDYLPRLKQENANVYERNTEVTKLDKDLSNYQNGKLSKIENDTKEKEKRIFVEDSHELRFVPSDLILKSDEDEETTNNQKECEKLDTLELSYKNIKGDPNLISTDSNNPKKNQTITNETDDFVEIKNIGYSGDISEGENVEKYDAKKEIAEEPLNPDIQKEENKLEQLENILKNTAEDHTLVDHTIENIPTNIDDKLLNEEENKNISEQETINGKPEPEQNTIQHTEIQNAEGEPPIQYNENQYDQHEQAPQIDKGGQIIQYDENGQVILFGDNGQTIQYGEQGQAIQYDENGQQIQYDENGQQIQYDENGQQIQFDENGQAIQYDENGQVIQYDQNGQAFQYDENGQPMYFDETGQRIHYDENGQPIQYDANGQPIQYDENGQPIQYDENGQSIQYDGNNQPIQYDENGQAIQYDENGQAIQYDENGQPIYQYQYDGNGQVIQQYGEYDSNAQNYQQYDENGQPLQDYSGEIPSEDNKHASNTENGHFGEEILPTDNANQPVEENIEIKEGMDIKPTTNKILDMLDTDTESLQQNISKVSNDSDFTVST